MPKISRLELLNLILELQLKFNFGQLEGADTDL